MIEEIFLFYRNLFLYLFDQIKKYFLYFSRNFFPKNDFKETVSRKSVSFLYLTLDPKLYSRLGVALLYRDEDVFFDSLSLQHIYIFLGKYEDIQEYLTKLRSRGLKVIFDQCFMENNRDKPIWRRRLSVVESIYTDIIVEDLDYSAHEFIDSEDWIDFEKSIFSDYSMNKKQYREMIDEFLKDGWMVSRLNIMISSVLLEALAELNSFKTPVNVIIEQSVKTVKNYCGEEESRLVNGLLEKCLRKSLEVQV